MAHSVRPDSYIEINNFYTVTVYEKGAEVVRMYHTLLGNELFTKGLQLYLQRHDGQACTIEDFVNAMQDASGKDLSQMYRWYDYMFFFAHVFMGFFFNFNFLVFCCVCMNCLKKV